MINSPDYDIKERTRRSEKLRLLDRAFGDALDFKVFASPALRSFIEQSTPDLTEQKPSIKYEN